MAHHAHHALHLKTLGKESGATGPKNESWQVKLNDPAISVMTDFRERAFFKIGADEHIDEALKKMRHAGLRAAFVMDKHGDKLLGLITAYDIMGEKPLRFMQGSGTNYNDILVSDIMEGMGDMPVLDIRELDHATVQSVLDIIQKSGRTHLPVMEYAEGEPPHLRGLISSSKVLRLTEDSRKVAQAK
ncbi:MAG TPA: CBS domain-containing protein [Gallionellaceae bacterium]